MKKTEDSQKFLQTIIKKEPLVKSAENGFNGKFNRNMKRFIYVSGFALMGICFTGCIAGYVDTEPVYVEGVRPMRPSETHIWIDGDWVYNRQSRSYARHEGHWDRPVQGKVYISGSWQTTPRGRHWNPGRWQRQN